MKLGRGRTTARMALLLGLGSLGAAAIARRGWVVETWWIHVLGSEGDGARREAIARLGAMRSKRAIPQLIEVIEASFDPSYPQTYLFSLGSRECSLERSWRIDKLREWRGSLDHDAVIALAQAGDSAAPALLGAMRYWSAAEKGRLAAILGLAAESLGNEAWRAPWASERRLVSLAPVAQKLLDERDPKVHALADWALGVIR